MKRFRFAFIPIGFLFFINPVFGLVDILPDFIGCALLFVGLRVIAELDDDLYLSTKHLGKLAIISASRLLLAILFASSDSSTILLFTFSWAIIEIVFSNLFLKSFFDGMEGIFNRNDGIQGLVKIENVKFLTYIFFITRIILGVLPEFCAILEVEAYSNIAMSQIYNDIISYKPYFMVATGLITFALGCYWYVELVKFVTAFKRDSKFIAALNSTYTDIIEGDDEGRTYASLWYGLVFIGCGMILYIDFLLNSIRILPDAIGTLLMMAGMLLLARLVKIKNIVPISVLTALVQGAFHIFVKKYVVFDVIVTDEIVLEKSLISAGVCLVYALFSLIFLYKVQTAVSQCAEYVRYTKHGSLPSIMLALYASHLALLTISITIPITQDYLSVLKTLLTLVFALVMAWHIVRIKEDYETARQYALRR